MMNEALKAYLGETEERPLTESVLRAEKSAHRTMTSDEPELIVEAIRSVIDGSRKKPNDA